MQFTWDLFIILFFAVFVIYGMLLGRNKILGILVNIFVALTVVTVIGEPVHDFMSHFQLISANLSTSMFGTKILLMVILVGLLTLKSEIAGADSGSLSTIETGIYGFFTAGVLLSSALSFMSYPELVGLNSTLASTVVSYYPLWIVTPILFIIGSAFVKR